MDAARASFENQLGGPVKFKVDSLDVEGGFAFMQVHPLRPDGSPYKIQRPDWTAAYGGALLERKSGKWTLLDMRVGPTDVWYCTYAARFPKGMLPYC